MSTGVPEKPEPSALPDELREVKAKMQRLVNDLCHVLLDMAEPFQEIVDSLVSLRDAYDAERAARQEAVAEVVRHARKLDAERRARVEMAERASYIEKRDDDDITRLEGERDAALKRAEEAEDLKQRAMEALGHEENVAEAARAEAEELRQAIGLATTAVPDMVMDIDDPIGMMQRVVAQAERLRVAVEAIVHEYRPFQEMECDCGAPLDECPNDPPCGAAKAYRLYKEALAGDAEGKAVRATTTREAGEGREEK